MDPIKLMNKIDIEKLKEKRNNNKECPECKSQNNIIINSECICKDCGLVLSGPIEYVGCEKIKYPYGLDLHIQ